MSRLILDVCGMVSTPGQGLIDGRWYGGRGIDVGMSTMTIMRVVRLGSMSVAGRTVLLRYGGRCDDTGGCGGRRSMASATGC